MTAAEMEEYKGPRAPSDSNLDDEDFDTFDGEAAKIGEIDLTSISQVALNFSNGGGAAGVGGNNRRVTSMDFLRRSRTMNN